MRDISDPVQGLQELLEKAAWDNFRTLARFKGLGRTLSQLALKLAGGTPEQEKLSERLAPLFENFDMDSLAGRQGRVAQALEALGAFRQGGLFALEAPLAKQGRADPPAGGEPPARETALLDKGGPPQDLSASLDALATEVTFVKGVGPKMAQVLARLGIQTVEDLLWHLPTRYEDRRNLKTISELVPGEFAVVKGRVTVAGRAGRRVFEAAVSDGTGTVRAKWFHFRESQLRDRLKKDAPIILAGKVDAYRGKLEIHHPDIEVGDEEDDLGTPEALVPVYPLTEGLHNKRLRRIIESALSKFGAHLHDGLPPGLLGEKLPGLAVSIEELHRPSSENDVGRLNARQTLYHRRVRVHEAFFMELGLVRQRAEKARAASAAFDPRPALLEKFLKALPFELTGAQKRSLAEIAADLSRPHPMHRLLQGDVGSGKTVVAAAASLLAIAAGYQSALMAPTEILAEQHFATLRKLLTPLDIPLALLTGSQKVSTVSVSPARIFNEIESGKIPFAVGTHALIYDRVQFARLGLVVVDEQHRFGVAQRAGLREKGAEPHVLVMTATPIPRTLALTVYGDLDVSILDELPPGRQPVRTAAFPARARRQVWRLVEGEIEKGRQAYVVYPLVAESEKLDLRNAVAAAEELQSKVFPDRKIGLLHGQMKPAEKEAVLSSFRRGELQVLVSTTVIEVGIDVPNATVMVVEHAERFGLSQLHQLRGRVGRGAERSHCFLVAGEGVSTESQERLKILEATSDGFRIAEEDLRLRGPGEFLGTRQSGLPDFKALDLVHDQKLLHEARQAALELLRADPSLSRAEHRALGQVLERRWMGRLGFLRAG